MILALALIEYIYYIAIEACFFVGTHQLTGISSNVCCRHDVISKLQNEFSLVVLVTENLTAYMKQIAIMARGECNQRD